MLRKKFNQYSKEADTIFPRNLIIKYGIIGLRLLPLEKRVDCRDSKKRVYMQLFYRQDRFICNCFIDKMIENKKNRKEGCNIFYELSQKEEI